MIVILQSKYSRILHESHYEGDGLDNFFLVSGTDSGTEGWWEGGRGGE
jgi:hypothetical protein